MNKYKIKTFGWKSPPLDVLSRIEEGFVSLGHELVEENPDIIYCNNDFFDDPLKYSENYPNAIKIFNILDLQLDNPYYDLNKLKEQLLQATFVTCISQTVRKQIMDNLQLNASVIYNPVKDVYNIPDTQKSFPFFYVGRANSPNKRYDLIRQTFILAEWNSSLIKVCGPEVPSFGLYGGIVNDDDLNTLYNEAGITLLPSKFEGIGLSGIESLICGTPVIECNDNPTAVEFMPPGMLCDPNPQSLMIKIKEINDNYEGFKEIALEYGNTYKQLFNKNTIAQNIISLL